MKPTRRWLAWCVATIAAAAAAAFALRGGTAPGEPGTTVPSTSASWRQQLEVAQVEAQWRGVDLLLWFEADDGIGFTEGMRRLVFGDHAIRRFLEQSFCIVELRYARSAAAPELPGALAGLVRVLGMEADGRLQLWIPSLVLADAEGRPYAVPRSYQGEAELFAEELVESCAVRERRDAAFLAAADASGLERAKALASALEQLDGELVIQAYAAEAREIADLDPDDDAGLGVRYARLARMGEVAPLVREVDHVALAAMPEIAPRRLKELLAPLERAHADVPEVIQAARYWVAVAHVYRALDAKDVQAIEKEIEAIRAIAPESYLVERLDALQKDRTRRQR